MKRYLLEFSSGAYSKSGIICSFVVEVEDFEIAENIRLSFCRQNNLIGTKPKYIEN